MKFEVIWDDGSCPPPYDSWWLADAEIHRLYPGAKLKVVYRGWKDIIHNGKHVGRVRDESVENPEAHPMDRVVDPAPGKKDRGKGSGRRGAGNA